MSTGDIPLDKAELLSTLLEALLYGFSLLMFGATIWTLSSKRSTHLVNRKMFTVACALLLVSTAHLVIDIIRIMEGLILYRDTYPGGPVAYFSDVSQWTFVSKNYVFTAQTLIGDGVLHRCYAVWQSKFIMILPALLWCAVFVTGIGSPYTASKVNQNEVFTGRLSQWITSFYSSTLTTNLLTTALLAFRIWHLDRTATRLLRAGRQSQLRPILHILVDAGAIYSVTLLAALICFAYQSNGQYVVLDMVTPIISITFYMVIIRVGLASRTTQTRNILRITSMDNSRSTERTPRTQVHITTLTESKVAHDQRSPTRLRSLSSNKNDQSEIRFDGGEGEM